MSTCFRLEAGVNKPTNQHTIAFIALTLLVRKSIQSVKKLNDVVLAWLSVWSKMLKQDANDLHVVQLMTLPPHHLLLY